MKYINKILFVLTVFISMGICSCSDGTEVLTPSDPPVNLFEPDPTDNSREAQIKRDFYKKTGIYILFDDYLGKYTDSNGVEHEEWVDFQWKGLTSGSSTIQWVFDKVSEEDVEKVIPYLEQYFIPYINVKGGQFRPYSVLLVKDLLAPDKWGDLNVADYISSMRCFAINVSDWIEADEGEAFYLGRNLIRTLASEKLNSFSPELQPFFEICQEHYDNGRVYRSFPEWLDNQDIELIYQAGFTRYYPDSYGDLEYDSFPYESTDLRLFLDHVFFEDENDFKQQWEDYPLIIQKYNLMKECVEGLGIDFNAVKL